MHIKDTIPGFHRGSLIEKERRMEERKKEREGGRAEGKGKVKERKGKERKRRGGRKKGKREGLGSRLYVSTIPFHGLLF